MPKHKAPVAQRVAFAHRVQAVIRARYGTRYRFQQAHQSLAGRVETWTFPQRKARPSRADQAALVMPDAASLAEFCMATGVSADWLLGLRGKDDAPEFAGVERPVPALAEDLAEYVRREVEERVRQQPVVGVLSDATGPLVTMPDAGARLLAFIVEAAEAAVRAAYPLEEQRVAASDALLAAQQAMAVYPTMKGRGALERAAAVLPRAMPAPAGVPMADAPPLRFTVAVSRTARAP